TSSITVDAKFVYWKAVIHSRRWRTKIRLPSRRVGVIRRAAARWRAKEAPVGGCRAQKIRRNEIPARPRRPSATVKGSISLARKKGPEVERRSRPPKREPSDDPRTIGPPPRRALHNVSPTSLNLR